MKAVIMAGGMGSRLRPLTCDLPKPMVPVLNRPVMEYIINLLAGQGIYDIAVTTFYLPQIIEDYFEDGSRWGVNLHYYIEEKPLGTAGSVQNAADFLDETFIVISGDAITDFNLQPAIEFHRQAGAEGTLVLSKENIPLDYGVVMIDGEGKIIRFLEKPGWGQVFSDTINTGIYILEPEIFALFTAGKKFDFSRDLFPLMLKEERPLYGLTVQGYWNDIGSLEAYHSTQFDFLGGRINLPLPESQEVESGIWLEAGVEIDSGADLIPPLYIGRETKIESGTILSECVIGGSSLIKTGSSLKKSLLWRNNIIGPDTEIRGSVLADNVVVKERAAVFDHTALGRKVEIGREARIKPGVKIWPEKNIAARSEVESSIIWTTRWNRHFFSDRGVVGESNVDITPEFAARLAAARGSQLGKNKTLTISSDCYGISQALKKAMTGALQSSGLNVIDLGSTITPAVRYSIPVLKADGGINVRISDRDSGQLIIEFFDDRGINITSRDQKAIEKRMFMEDFNRVSPGDIGLYSRLTEMNNFYREEVINSIEAEVIRHHFFNLVVDYEYENLKKFLPQFLNELNCRLLSTHNYSPGQLPLSLAERIKIKENVLEIMNKNQSDLGLIMDHNASRLHLITPEGKVVDEINYRVLISYLLLERGFKSLSLPLDSPAVIENMASQYGAEVIYTPLKIGEMMGSFFQKNRAQNFYPYKDALYGLGLILEKMAVEDVNFSHLLRRLPDYYLHQARIPCSHEDKGRIMRHLCDENRDDKELIDGVKFQHENGWALVIPDSEKPSFHIYAEGRDAEAAESLTGFYLEKVNSLLGD